MKNAFLIQEGVLYQADPLFSSQVGYTPVTALIEGIWNTYPNQAYSLLRERIYSNYPFTSSCEGMIKVAAKRASALTQEQFEEEQKKSTSTQILSPKVFQNEFQLNNSNTHFPLEEQKKRLVLKTKSRSLHSLHRYESDRAVGAAAFTQTGEIINLSWNTNAKNKTLHAELNLVRSYEQKAKTLFPDHSEIWVSLKPCAMCAALLFSSVKNPETLKIVYLEDDPGPFSKNSVFCEGSDLWIKAGRPKLSIRQFKPA